MKDVEAALDGPNLVGIQAVRGMIAQDVLRLRVRLWRVRRQDRDVLGVRADVELVDLDDVVQAALHRDLHVHDALHDRPVQDPLQVRPDTNDEEGGPERT